MAGLPENPLQCFMLAADSLPAQHAALAAWIRAGVEQYVRIGEHPFGLTGTLGRPPRLYFLRDRRNALLREALAECGSYRKLAIEVQQYQQRVSARERLQSKPSDSWSTARKLVHQAHAMTVKVPTTTKGLRKALKGN